jgi:hypothetical protein
MPHSLTDKLKGKNKAKPDLSGSDSTKGDKGGKAAELRSMSFADAEKALKPPTPKGGLMKGARDVARTGGRGLANSAGAARDMVKGAGKAVVGAGQAVVGAGRAAVVAGNEALANLGKKDDDKLPAEHQNLTDADWQALSLTPDAYRMQGAASAEYAAEIEAWIAKHGNGTLGTPDGHMKGMQEQLSPRQRLLLELQSSVKDIKASMPSADIDARRQQNMLARSPDGPKLRDDPFHYDRSELPKETLDGLRAVGLTEDELIAVQLYTGGASYPMNAVLRGELQDEGSIRAYLPWALKLDSALSKMPSTVRNLQTGRAGATEHAKIDPTKEAGEMLDISTISVYRADKWTPAFQQEVQSNWAVGATITNPSFFSTTTIKGSYPGSVQRNIRLKDKQAAASIIDISSVKHENEVLFRPNTQMKITAIRKVGGQLPKVPMNFDRVQNPEADLTEITKRHQTGEVNLGSLSQFKPEELKNLLLDVDVVVEAGPGGGLETQKKPEENKAPPAKDTKGDKKAREAQENAQKSAVSNLLGRLMTKKQKG